MNDINDMPRMCQSCHYWEWAKRPYICDECKERYEKNDIPE